MYKLTLILFAFVSLVFPVLAVDMSALNETEGLAQRDIGFSGIGTPFAPGLGACGITSNSSQLVVAIPASIFGRDFHCGQLVNIASGGNSANTTVVANKTIVVADATVVDECLSCGDQDIGMSPALFLEFAPFSAGSIDITWSFI